MKGFAHVPEKNIRPSPIVGHPTIYLASTPHTTVKVIKNKESQRHRCRSEEGRKTWQLNVMWCPTCDPRTGKGR